MYCARSHFSEVVENLKILILKIKQRYLKIRKFAKIDHSHHITYLKCTQIKL